MTASPVLAEARDGILRVTVNRPEKRNALSQAVLAELKTIFDAHAGDDSLKLGILTGAGDKSFAAGGDLRELSALRDLDQSNRMGNDAKAAVNAVRQFPVPVIAALNGDAMGGGAELAVACDFRVAAAHARIGFLQGRLNIATGWGGGIDVMQIVGTHVALGLLCRAEMLNGAEALRIGLIDAVAEDGENLAAALDRFTAPLLERVPQVMRAFKALATGVRANLPRVELEAIETEMMSHAWVHDDHWTAAAAVERRLKKGS
ncbi:MAG: enoyl-CoA hydratase/isomerase family protein [Alphaproteobacteria bacterium]